MKLITIATLLIFTALLFGCSKEIEPKKIEPGTRDYYDSFREKCKDTWDDKCCLASVDRAEKENSPLFESNNGGMDIDNKCPDGYILDMLKCRTSYIWCVKK